MEPFSTFQDLMAASLAEAFTRERIKRAAQKARAAIHEAEAKLTPIERMNRRYPNMKLHQLPENMRKLFGDPDVDVCLQYYRRFMAASKSEGDEPVAILCEFLREHSIEFQCSGWVWYAFGYIVLGYPDLRNCERRARRLFSAYWRDINSPKHKKFGQQFMGMLKAQRELDSEHATHWRVVVKWMNRAEERGLARTRWFDEYSRPARTSAFA